MCPTPDGGSGWRGAGRRLWLPVNHAASASQVLGSKTVQGRVASFSRQVTDSGQPPNEGQEDDPSKDQAHERRRVSRYCDGAELQAATDAALGGPSAGCELEISISAGQIALKPQSGRGGRVGLKPGAGRWSS
jgi:hypothetical protein